MSPHRRGMISDLAWHFDFETAERQFEVDIENALTGIRARVRSRGLQRSEEID
ncbi:MAG: hypothetical protein O3C27_04325 [Actinomycetota bacterium]|nr:hypothetical protein [Actinomycetota bacterium]